MRDVARWAGVSIATVSHVINGSRIVSTNTAQRVRQAMKELGYQPNVIARQLRRQRTDTLGLVLSNVTNPFFPALVQGVEDVVTDKGYSVILCNTGEDPVNEARHLRVLESRRVDGLIVVPSTGGTDALRALAKRHRALVLVDRLVEELTVDAVLTDNVRGAYEGTSHLIRHGHRAIAAIHGPQHLTTGHERLQGYLAALRDHGIEARPEWVCCGDFLVGSGRQLALQLLSGRPRPTAVFVANNLMGLGVLEAVRAMGTQVPQELAIVIFDDMPWAPYVRPSITAVAQSPYDMGVAAARLVLRRLGGEQGDPEVVRLPVEVIIRESCGCGAE